MIYHATVHVDHDELTREVWRFCLLDRQGVVLDAWRFETRETKRHKFKANQYDGSAWQRIDQRGNRCEKPTAADWVKEKAVNIIRASIDMAE